MHSPTSGLIELIVYGFDEYKDTAKTRIYTVRHDDNTLAGRDEERTLNGCDRRQENIFASNRVSAKSKCGETAAPIVRIATRRRER